MADAGRVIAGRAKGIRLAAPGPGTRPLADRVKQTLFAILEPELRGARLLDLFAGSGAAGLEALSRGAATVVFVERDGAAVATIRANLARTGLAGQAATIVRGDVLAYLASEAAVADGAFDLAVLDPPYAATELLSGALAALGDPASGLLKPGARVVAKHFWRHRPPDVVGLLASERERRFGETSLTFYRFADERTGHEREETEAR